jgi:protein-L-isoaspartate(D-aspartate) O-methyltransferase
MGKRDFTGARSAMVEEQLRHRGISDIRVLEAMERIPRHLFIPPDHQSEAYEDRPIPIGEGQTISQPYMVALMTQTLSPDAKDRVLEIGTGSGYQTAILAELCRKVFTIERISSLRQKAEETLGGLGYANVSFRTGDGSKGWSEEAPFEGIMVTAAAPRPPQTLTSQLSEGGRLIIPAGSRYSQTLYRITRQGEKFLEEEVTGCVFVPLVGAYGWEEE